MVDLLGALAVWLPIHDSAHLVHWPAGFCRHHNDSQEYPHWARYSKCPAHCKTKHEHGRKVEQHAPQPASAASRVSRCTQLSLSFSLGRCWPCVCLSLSTTTTSPMAAGPGTRHPGSHPRPTPPPPQKKEKLPWTYVYVRTVRTNKYTHTHMARNKATVPVCGEGVESVVRKYYYMCE